MIPRPGPQNHGKDLAVLLLLALPALVFCLPPGQSDFASFCEGSRMLGSPELYSLSTLKSDRPGHFVPPYVRPPYFALALRPICSLPRPMGFYGWQLLNLAGIYFFFRIWVRQKRIGALICASFPPLWMGLHFGQDVGIALAILAVAVRALESGKQWTAGIATAMLLGKPHLFFLTPLSLLRRPTALLALGGALAVLCGISFAIAGSGWPWRLARLSLAHDQNLHLKLINLAGLFTELADPVRIWLIAGLLGLFLAGFRYLSQPLDEDWKYRLGLLIAVGIALSHRALPYDAAYLLPLLLSSAPSLSEWDLFTALALGCAAVAGAGLAPLLVFGLLMAVLKRRRQIRLQAR